MTSWDKIGEDISKGPAGLLKWCLIFIVIVSVIGGILTYWSKFTNTVVDRVILKNSFQYVEGMEQRAAILKANIEEIDLQLRYNPDNKEDLLKQKMILNVQLKAITTNKGDLK